MSAATEAELAAAQAAIGRTERREQLLDAESLRRFAIAIGGDGDVEAAPPVLAHWAWFLPHPADAELGPDGHPARGGFLPAFAGLPRRMFAATSMTFAMPLVLDAPAEATVRIADVTHKAGRSGDLAFVEVERTIAQRGATRVIERQTVVYRGAGAAAPLPLPEPAADADLAPAGGELWRPGTVNLFRFSAVTFNGHRIHYDRPYATEIEGYPALIVHGPFIAAKLAELAARAGPIATFEFRASNPCFVDQPIRLVAAGDGEFSAVRCDGALSTSARATYR